MLILHTKSEKETFNLGFLIGKNIFYPSVIALIGDLGSGKTTFTQGIAKGMGIEERVKSPTFVIINEYQAPHPLYHFDLYRIKSSDELFELGYEEYISDKNGVVVIEWAEKILNLLPPEHLEVNIKIKNFNLREIFLMPRKGKNYLELISKIKKEVKC